MLYSRPRSVGRFQCIPQIILRPIATARVNSENNPINVCQQHRNAVSIVALPRRVSNHRNHCCLPFIQQWYYFCRCGCLSTSVHARGISKVRL